MFNTLMQAHLVAKKHAAMLLTPFAAGGKVSNGICQHKRYRQMQK